MQRSKMFSLLSIFLCYSLLNGCINHNDSFSVKTADDNSRIIDTINSINRFVGYYNKKSFVSLENNQFVIPRNQDKIPLVEIMWKDKKCRKNDSSLIYKTDIENSVFLFLDKASKVLIYPGKDQVADESLSKRNEPFLDFQVDLKNIYSKRKALETWADSIRSLPVNDSLKRYVYKTYKKRIQTVNTLRDSLFNQVQKYE